MNINHLSCSIVQFQYFTLHCIALRYIVTLRYVASRRVTSDHISSRRVTLRHIASRRVTSRRVMSRHDCLHTVWYINLVLYCVVLYYYYFLCDIIETVAVIFRLRV